ncbi:MAG: CoA ester lyase [Kiloniellales bacterium]|nr:CoA ester lyase [Kiloniellales bacterium]
MSKSFRPRRSVLYMPGSNTRALEKGRSLPADALILDLEDAVSADAKMQARSNVVAAIAEGGYGHRELVVRVNAFATPWGYEDLVAVSASKADAVLLPKVESPAVVRQAEAVLAANNAPESMEIWAMMETPLGMLHAEAIAGASPRLGCLVMGTSDLAKDLHASHTRDRMPMITSLGLCLLAARAYGLDILDGVHLDLRDDEGLAHSCAQGVAFGFDGKTLIHPRTIEIANRAFSPSDEEVDWSHKIIAAHAEAMAQGKGVAVYEGKLIENLHVENAQRIVAMAEAIAAREPERVAAVGE